MKILNKKNEDIEFEKALEKLEKIVEKLESGDLSLSESLDNFSEGVELIKYCRNELNKAEKKVETVLKDNEGEFGDIVPFDEEE
ncbi:MAG: exodeoxyribonuclease VII small subunit [Bacillota bacterium]